MAVRYYRAIAVWDDGKTETTHRTREKALASLRGTYDPDGVYTGCSDAEFINGARTEGLRLSIIEITS